MKFTSIVETIFGFAKHECGFTVVHLGDRAVEFRKGDVFFRLTHSEADEVAMRIGKLSEGFENGFSVGALVALEDEKRGFALRDRIASTPDQVRAALVDHGELLKVHGKRVLEGDLKVFDEMRELVGRYWQSRRDNQIRQSAERAFAQKNYTEALRHYGNLKGVLRPLDQKRVKICKRSLL